MTLIHRRYEVARPTSEGARRRALLGVLSGIVVALILVAGYLVYAPGLTGPFFFDDFPNIVNNDHLKIAALTFDQLQSAAFSSRAGPLYRPIAMASFALNRYFTGLDPYWFKFTNLMIHLASGVLMIILCRLLLASYREQRALWLSRERIRWVSLLVAAAWLVNPLNLTAVLYVVQRMVGLASLFMLAAVVSYVIGRRRQLADRSGWAFIWIGAPMLALLGLFTKEIAALVPLYLLVIELVVFRFRGVHRRFNRPILVFFTLGLVIPFLFGLGWLLVHFQSFFNGYNGRDFTLIERLLTEARVLMMNVKWTLAPNVADLSLYHDDVILSTGLLQPITTVLSLIGIAAMAVLAWLTRRRAPLVTLGILWFFAGHALESTILPLEIIHEHRNYLPDYGLLLAVCSLLLLPRAQTRKLLVGGGTIAVVFVGLLASVTHTRAAQWSSRLTQTYYEAQHHPDSPRAAYSFAAEEATLAMQGRLENPEEAITDLEALLDSNKSAMPNVALIKLAASLERPIQKSWLTNLKHKLHNTLMTAQDIDSLNILLECDARLCDLGRGPMEAIFAAALSNPRLGRGYNYANLLTLYINYLTHQHVALDRLIALMYEVVHAQPAIPQYRNNLAQALIVNGQLDAAQKQIAALGRMNNVGQLNETIGQLRAALANKQAAMADKPRAGALAQ